MQTSLWRTFCRDEAGQDLVEYALLVALVSLCALSLLLGLQGNINSLWNEIGSGLSAAIQAVS
jgi:pilus assembly protein Flp/PilA